MTVTWNKVSSDKLTEISSGYHGLTLDKLAENPQCKLNSAQGFLVSTLNKEDKWHNRVDMGYVLH